VKIFGDDQATLEELSDQVEAKLDSM
jgi:Cu/Ag efflux pump CusA